MSFQVLDDPSKDAFGKALGQGLSSGLQNLMQHKMQAMQEQKRVQSNLSLLKGLGVPEDKARMIAPVSEDILSVLLKGGSASTTPGLASGESLKQQEFGLKQRAAQRVENKEVREYLEPYKKSADASENNIRDYKYLIQLADKKDLRSGNAHLLLEKLGLEKFGQNITTQLVQKVSARLGQNAASAFGPGAKLTNFLETTYQKSIPSLANTPEGIKVLSEINMKADEANLLKQNAREEIIIEHGGIPLDIDKRVKEATQEQVDRLENEGLNIALNSSRRVTKTFDKVPKASEYPDKLLRFPDGSLRRSNGKEWVKEKQ